MTKSILSTASLIAVMAAGCVTKPVIGPDGTEHYSITCKASVDRCFRKAGDLCPAGYKIVERNDESGVSVNKNPSSKNQFAWLIKCNDAPSVAH